MIVVGAGAMGSAAAWHLARDGVDVILLERFEPGHTRGSSHGGSRIFRLAYADPAYVRLALDALDGWAMVEDDCATKVLDLTGGVDHGPSSEVSDVANALEAAGRKVERLSPAAAQERWPGFLFDQTVVFSPDTGRLLADVAVATLQDATIRHGGSVRFGAAVVEVDPSARAVTLDDGQVLTARHALVITAGAWVEKLLRGTALHNVLPPIRVSREQVFHFAPAPDDATVWPSFIHYTDPGRYGLLTPGEGVKVAEHGTGPATDPDARSFAVDEIGRQRVVNYVERWLPGLLPRPVSSTTCLYTNTPDASFVLERHGDVVIGSACSGHGFKFTPAIGKHLADLARQAR